MISQKFVRLKHVKKAGVAQLVVRRLADPNGRFRGFFLSVKKMQAGVAQLVERQLPKL
jgi:hypothetical protein